MSDLQIFAERNKIYAQNHKGRLPLMPTFSTVVLTCVDSRIDPAYFLGLKEGEAIIIRNAGARITEEVEKELGILSVMASLAGGDEFKGLSLAIVQHTDCGYERLANPQIRSAIHHKVGIDMNELEFRANDDHTATLKDDIEKLRQSSYVPNNLVISGHIFNVDTGLIEEIFTPESL